MAPLIGITIESFGRGHGTGLKEKAEKPSVSLGLQETARRWPAFENGTDVQLSPTNRAFPWGKDCSFLVVGLKLSLVCFFETQHFPAQARRRRTRLVSQAEPTPLQD
jgi:hypothetical protein